MSATLGQRAASRRLLSGQGITATESRFGPDLRIEPHSHDTGYVCLVLYGTCQESSDHRLTAAVPGSVDYMPQGMLHSNAFGSMGSNCLLVEIDQCELEWLQDAGCETRRPWGVVGGSIARNFFKLFGLLRHGRATSLDVQEFLVHSFTASAKMPAAGRVPPMWLSRVREILDVAGPRQPSLASLASEAGVHPAHLPRAFRAHVGCSVGEYCQARRVAAACQMLLEGELPLARIAQRLGYHDQSHFTRLFKDRTGVTPGEFRLGSPLEQAP